MMTTDRISRRLASRIAEHAGQPVAHVIVQDVWLSVVEGSLRTGQRLPTARELAVTLGVSPRIVEGAYGQLERLGVTTTRRGEGTFVGLSPPSEEERARYRSLHETCREAVERVEALGFDVVDLLEAIGEYRDADRGSLSRGSSA
ncbi:MAG: GntR family transcriptional regulator [Gemmatimonadota bacterium]